MRLNSINSGVSPGGWAHAAVMIGAVFDNDGELFKQAMAVPTRWEHEALASIAAAAVTELADHTQETPAAVLRRLQQALAAAR